MKAIKFTGVLLTAALLSMRVMAQSDQLVVPLSDPGKPYKVEVNLVNGSIKVAGYDGKEVVIEVQSESKRRERDDDDHSKNGMHRINGGNSMDITAKEKNNTVTIGSDMPSRGGTVSIKIPRNIANLKVSTINGGVIVVSNVNGEIEADNTNGAIVLTDISGSVVANSINGAVKVAFKSIDPKAMAFSTLNGVIDVTFPANLKANVKLKSDRGNVYSDFDIVTDKQTPKVTKSNSEGMYRLTVDETINGKIDGGGPELIMKSMNGNIYLHKAK